MNTIRGTYAYARFNLILHRTNEMLEISLLGADNKIKDTEDILKSFDKFKGIPGKIPQDYNPIFEIKKHDSEDKYSLEMDNRIAFKMKNVMSNYLKITEELKNHYYSILLVYIWAAYETYFCNLFQELFNRKIEMLKTNENITYTNIIENKDSILEFIINKELEKIGHFSIEEHFDYLDKKINFKFPKTKQSRLRATYLIRNIIAHNTGMISTKYKNRLPKSVRTKNNELILSRTFLDKEISNIKSAVDMIERHVKTKFSFNFLCYYDGTKRAIMIK